MVSSVICCRQVKEYSSGNYAILVVILDVLESGFRSWLVHDFPGLIPTFSLIRCDSTVGVILFRMIRS